jgi:hypothetical protein
VPQAFAKFAVAFTRKWTGVSTFTPDFNTCTTWGKKKEEEEEEEEEEDFHVVLKLSLVKILMAHLWVECQEHIGDRSTKVPLVCFRYGALPSPDTVRECRNLPRLLVFSFSFWETLFLFVKVAHFSTCLHL